MARSPVSGRLVQVEIHQQEVRSEFHALSARQRGNSRSHRNESADLTNALASTARQGHSASLTDLFFQNGPLIPLDLSRTESIGVAGG